MDLFTCTSTHVLFYNNLFYPLKKLKKVKAIHLNDYAVAAFKCV